MDFASTALASGAHDDRLAAAPPYEPFWFEVWRSVGWSRRVARIWSRETAYRTQDTSYLARVLPTLAPEDRTFVEDVIRSEAFATAGAVPA